MCYATVRLIPLLLVQLQQVISHQFVGRAFGGDQKVQKSGLSGILCGGPVSSVEEPLAKDDGELCLCLDPFP
ncbi:hypothetical protein CN135_17565, partial [Sinorhizobium meliloti]